MVEEAAAYGHLKRLFATTAKQEECSRLPADEKYLISEAIAHKITHLQKTDGIFAEVQMPAFKTVLGLNRVMILEETNDPGNLGALIRTALALGWEGILLLGNCCDPFNDKALRAAKGATFRIPIQQSSWAEILPLLDKKTQLVAADLEGTPLEEYPLRHGPLFLVMGNEAKGISAEAKVHCQKVTIPMHGPIESLNVAAAGAILLYKLGYYGK